MPPESSAAFAHARCYRAFEELLDALQSPSRDYKDQLSTGEVEEEFQKYSIWAGSVGAAHSGKSYQISLDYRLRESSFFKETVSSSVTDNPWSR